MKRSLAQYPSHEGPDKKKIKIASNTFFSRNTGYLPAGTLNFKISDKNKHVKLQVQTRPSFVEKIQIKAPEEKKITIPIPKLPAIQPQPASVPKEKPILLVDKFKQGDLVFGLDKPRAPYIKTLEEKKFTHTYANCLNSPAVDLFMQGVSNDRAKKELTAPQYKHFLFLQRNQFYFKFNPSSGKSIPLMAEKNPTLGAAYGRSCKKLLTNRDVGRTSDAHVVTTKINWARVFTKDKKDAGVTNREMRDAARDFWRNGENPHIFYYDENGCLIRNFWKQLEKNPVAAEPMRKYKEHVLGKKR